MPLRSVMMKRFIFGFQRRGWWPKCTPLSRSWRMVTTAMALDSLSSRRRHAAGPAEVVSAGSAPCPASFRLSQVVVTTCPDARQELHPTLVGTEELRPRADLSGPALCGWTDVR